MYERFTDRARKVMQLAHQEALRMNFEYIGTEHVLLGLIKEGSGVAAHVLKNFDMGLLNVRQQIEKLLGAAPADRVVIGKLPMTPRAKRLLTFAAAEARNLGHNCVGTEHLLLALTRLDQSVACHVWLSLGHRIEDVRSEVFHMLDCDDTAVLPVETYSTTRVIYVVDTHTVVSGWWNWLYRVVIG
ncbi:hypothetical protein CL628_00465 [bacterium]|nr:hypothetical protein [bacterium]